MHTIQSEACQRIVQPLHLVARARDRLVLHRHPGLAEQVDADDSAVLEQRGNVDPPHRSGRVAARQQHHRRTGRRSVKPVGAHGAE